MSLNELSYRTIVPIKFPTISVWDGVNNTQIISPIDNPKREGLYGRTNNHLDRITRQFPHTKKDSIEKRAEPQREVIWLTGIMHRNPFGMIDFTNTFNQEYGAIFTFFDNPKATFDLDRIADQVIDYLKQMISRDTTKEFVLCGASAGEMLARSVYEKLNTPEYEYILPHIRHHFSICGVSTFDQLGGAQRLLLRSIKTPLIQAIGRSLSRNISKKINDILGENWLMRQIGDNLLAPVTQINSQKLQEKWKQRHPEFLQDSDKPNKGVQLNREHRRRGAISLTQAHNGIFESIMQQAHIVGPRVTPPTTILYSSDDMGSKGIYYDPKTNANMGSTFYHHPDIVKINKGGHVDVVFQSEKYLTPIRAVLDALWRYDDTV